MIMVLAIAAQKSQSCQHHCGSPFELFSCIRVDPRPIQRDLMIATEIIALSHREEYDPFQAITASTNKSQFKDGRHIARKHWKLQVLGVWNDLNVFS